MALPDLTEADRAILAQLIRERIAADRFPLSPRVTRLKAILAKINPASAEKPAVTPYAAPKPSGEPSLLYRNLRGGGRRMSRCGAAGVPAPMSRMPQNRPARSIARESREFRPLISRRRLFRLRVLQNFGFAVKLKCPLEKLSSHLGLYGDFVQTTTPSSKPPKVLRRPHHEFSPRIGFRKVRANRQREPIPSGR